MDSLIIQDGFEPYYADRRPFRVAIRAARRIEVRVTTLAAGRHAMPGDEGVATPSPAGRDDNPR